MMYDTVRVERERGASVRVKRCVCVGEIANLKRSVTM